MPDAPAAAAESTPTTEATQAAEASSVEASASPTTEAAPDSSADIDAWIRGRASGSGSTLNFDDVVSPEASASETASDDSAAQSGADVTTDDQTPSGGPQPSGRRSKAAQADQDRIANLEARVREYEAPTYRDRVRSEVLAEQAQQTTVAQSQADAERFTRLMRTPDADLTGDDYTWREEQKELLARYPQAQAMYDGLVSQERQSLYADLEGKQAAFWASVQADMDAATSLPNVDLPAVRQAPSFAARDRLMHAAGAASKEAEYAPRVASLEAQVKELQHELGDARLGNLGRAASPFSGGTSAGAVQTSDIDTWIRQRAGLA